MAGCIPNGRTQQMLQCSWGWKRIMDYFLAMTTIISTKALRIKWQDSLPE